MGFYEFRSVWKVMELFGIISYLQRNLEIGYNRAKIIIELLEAEKVITTPTKNEIRKINK